MLWLRDFLRNVGPIFQITRKPRQISSAKEPSASYWKVIVYWHSPSSDPGFTLAEKIIWWNGFQFEGISICFAFYSFFQSILLKILVQLSFKPFVNPVPIVEVLIKCVCYSLLLHSSDHHGVAHFPLWRDGTPNDTSPHLHHLGTTTPIIWLLLISSKIKKIPSIEAALIPIGIKSIYNKNPAVRIASANLLGNPKLPFFWILAVLIFCL